MLDRRTFLRGLSLPLTASLLGCKTRDVVAPENETVLETRFRFPGEWHPHELTLMAMPPPQNWRGSGIRMEDVHRQWADVANALNEFEQVLMVVRPRDRERVSSLLDSAIEILELPLNDGWTRDTGPMFVVNDAGERRVAGFRFNGWGDKFGGFDEDAKLKQRLAEHLGVPFDPIDMVLEGGAVHMDGEGTIITTKQCLLHENRNPDMSQAEIEALLNESLGTSTVIWLDEGLGPDPITDGHVDGLCAFVQPGMVLVHSTDDASDPNRGVCRSAKAKLRETPDARGRTLEVIDLPLGRDLSHINFYLGNGCVLVPTTGDPRLDDAPLGVLREAFFDREVVGIESRILVDGGGGIHCITQQVPALES